MVFKVKRFLSSHSYVVFFGVTNYYVRVRLKLFLSLSMIPSCQRDSKSRRLVLLSVSVTYLLLIYWTYYLLNLSLSVSLFITFFPFSTQTPVRGCTWPRRPSVTARYSPFASTKTQEWPRRQTASQTCVKILFQPSVRGTRRMLARVKTFR